MERDGRLIDLTSYTITRRTNWQRVSWKDEKLTVSEGLIVGRNIVPINEIPTPQIHPGNGMIIEPYSTTGLEFMPGIKYLTLCLQSHCAHKLPQ